MLTLYTSPILQKIYDLAGQYPDKIALTETGGKEISYAKLVQEVDTMALQLVQQGFQLGDRVLVLVRPGINVIVVMLAILRCGGVIVLADLAMGRESFESRMTLAAPRWVMVETLLLVLQRFGWVRALLKRRGVEIPEISHLHATGKVVNIGPGLPGLGFSLTLSQLLKPVALAYTEAALSPSADLLVVFTSGTTALPKGVVHSHASIDAVATLILEKLDLATTDVVYSNSIHLLIPALLTGALAIIPRSKLKPPDTLAIYHKFKVTKTFMVPAEGEEIIDYCKLQVQTLPPHLDTLMLGAAPVSTGFLARLEAILEPTTKVWSIYGMSEMLPIAMATLEEKLAYQNEGGKGDLLGYPLEGIQTEIAPDGELILQGANLFKGYLGQPPVDRFPSGDLAQVDVQGRLILLGRKKDMIIRRDHNIYPAMLEDSINQIQGVKECAMVGYYDHKISDEVLVLVVDKADSRDDETYRRFLQKELLTGPHSIDLYAQPDQIVFRSLPRSGRSQKVDKKALRAQLEQPHS